MNWLAQSTLAVVSAVALATPLAKAESAPTLAERLGYKSTDKLLIINGDDTGMCHAANDATIESLEEARVAVWTYARDLVERAQGNGVFRTDLRTDLLLAAASAQVRGMAGALIYADSQALEEIAVDELIESGMAFIREALVAR